jgi:hypothetical protein
VADVENFHGLASPEVATSKPPLRRGNLKNLSSTKTKGSTIKQFRSVTNQAVIAVSPMDSVNSQIQTHARTMTPNEEIYGLRISNNTANQNPANSTG